MPRHDSAQRLALLVWNNEGGEEPAFADLPDLNGVMELVMDHCKIAGTLFDKPEDYAPLFEVFRKRAGGASFQSRAPGPNGSWRCCRGTPIEAVTLAPRIRPQSARRSRWSGNAPGSRSLGPEDENYRTSAYIRLINLPIRFSSVDPIGLDSPEVSSDTPVINTETTP